MYIYFLYNLKTLEKKEIKARSLSEMWENNKDLSRKEWIVEWSSWVFNF